MGGCRRLRDPGCARRSKKKVCLFASLVLPRPEAANLKSCPGWGAGDPAPRGSPSFPAVPLLQRQAWEGGQGSQALCPALCRAPPTGAGRGAARETPAGAGGCRRRRHSRFHAGLPVRPPFGQAFLCAPTVRTLGAHCAQGALRGPQRPRPSLPGTAPLFPRASARVTSGCVFANCISAIGSGVPPR